MASRLSQQPVADPKILKRVTDNNLSAPSSFVANAHKDLYAFYTEKGSFLKKIEPIGGGRPNAPAPSFESVNAHSPQCRRRVLFSRSLATELTPSILQPVTGCNT